MTFRVGQATVTFGCNVIAVLWSNMKADDEKDDEGRKFTGY